MRHYHVHELVARLRRAAANEKDEVKRQRLIDAANKLDQMYAEAISLAQQHGLLDPEVPQTILVFGAFLSEEAGDEPEYTDSDRVQEAMDS